MTPELIAESRTSGMTPRAAANFMAAYHKALSAHRCDQDLDDVWHAARTNRKTSNATIAGLIEGIAAARGGAR